MKKLITIVALVVVGFNAQAQIRNLNLDLRNIVIGIGYERSGGNAGATFSVIDAGGIGGEISFGAGGKGSGSGYIGALVSYDLLKSKTLTRFLKKGKFNVNVGVGIIGNQVYETKETSSKTYFNHQEPAQLIGQTYKLQAKVGVRFKMLQASIGMGSQGLNVGFGFILKRNRK